MANQEHLKLIRRSVAEWNSWRAERRQVEINTSGFEVDLVQADLHGADLHGADLNDADLEGADLRDANLTQALLSSARLHRAALAGADLSSTFLDGADFSLAWLSHANFWYARLGWSDLSGCDLGDVRHLETVEHHGPSLVDFDTLRQSGGRIPQEFLRGCGLADWEREFAGLYSPDLDPFTVEQIALRIFDDRTTGPMFLGGVFISYSQRDSAVVDKLEDQLKKNGCVVWRDVHSLVAGPLVRQISEAIRAQDAVVVVLSNESIHSDWVVDEVEKARKRERKEGRDFLCPIALDDSWKALDHPLWTQLKREKNILEFSGWANDTTFAVAFDKLLRGLKLYYPPTRVI